MPKSIVFCFVLRERGRFLLILFHFRVCMHLIFGPSSAQYCTLFASSFVSNFSLLPLGFAAPRSTSGHGLGSSAGFAFSRSFCRATRELPGLDSTVRLLGRPQFLLALWCRIFSWLRGNGPLESDFPPRDQDAGLPSLFGYSHVSMVDDFFSARFCHDFDCVWVSAERSRCCS
jgi:hypothetical protein